MATVFSSKPIQASNQWELIRVAVVPSVIPSRRMGVTRGLISKGRSLTNMFGVWAQKLNLADFTRKWCSGSTKSFDLFRLGSIPIFLRSWGDSNPHNLLYQSNPLFRHSSFRTGGGVQRWQWEEQGVK